MATHHLPRRLTLLLFLHTGRTDFPVNLLRNTAIRNVATTHFLVLDMDLWPCRRSLFSLARRRRRKGATSHPDVGIARPQRRHPPRLLLRPQGAAEALLLRGDLRADVAAERPSRVERWTSCRGTSASLSPASSPDTATRRRTACGRTWGWAAAATQMYVMPEWYLAPREAVVSRVECFVTDFQEPYVLLRYDAETPLFDERFANYGYNKVQLIEHLRAAGYRFYILNHVFAMDLPHPDSLFRKNYLSSLDGESLKLQRVYRSFQQMLNTKYANVTSFGTCPVLKAHYYTYVMDSCECLTENTC